MDFLVEGFVGSKENNKSAGLCSGKSSFPALKYGKV